MFRSTENSTKEAHSGQTWIYARRLGLMCLVLLCMVGSQFARAQSDVDEYQVKAAFLFHFAQFLAWPSDSLNAQDRSITLCIFDDEPRRQELQSTVEGKLIGARTFHVRLISLPQEIQGCNILFLSRDEARRQSGILKSLRGMPVLTVGETSDFLADGGMIRFHLEEGKTRFDINLAAAESSHLQISSRLLLLATSVSRGAVAERGR
jgi:YfiR/HmsC-like